MRDISEDEALLQMCPFGYGWADHDTTCFGPKCAAWDGQNGMGHCARCVTPRPSAWGLLPIMILVVIVWSFVLFWFWNLNADRFSLHDMKAWCKEATENNPRFVCPQPSHEPNPILDPMARH